MKQIIDGKLYNTENAKLIFSFVKNFSTVYIVNCCRDVDLYKTNKGNYFIHIKQANEEKNGRIYFGKMKEYLETITEENAKTIIQKLDVNKYIELFGEVEEG